MRKYVVGILIGFALSFAVGANAEVVNMIGKTIEGTFPVKVDGKQLENQAIVVEGTSYLPVREIGDALGMDVLFDATVGIELKKKGESGLIPTDEEQSKLKLQLYDLRKQQQDLTNQISDLYKIIDPYENLGNNNKQQDSIYFEAKKKREDLLSRRDEIDKQIKALTNQQKEITDQKMEQLREQLK